MFIVLSAKNCFSWNENGNISRSRRFPLLEIVRYIHLNPVRAGIVKDLKGLSNYWKCGHSVLIGKNKKEWQDTNYILALFDKKGVSARRSYSDFVRNGVKQGSRPDLVGGGLVRSAGGWSALIAMRSVGLRIMGDERILGSGDFVESVLKQANEEFEKKTLAKAKGLDLKYITWCCCNIFQYWPQNNKRINQCEISDG